MPTSFHHRAVLSDSLFDKVLISFSLVQVNLVIFQLWPVSRSVLLCRILAALFDDMELWKRPGRTVPDAVDAVTNWLSNVMPYTGTDRGRHASGDRWKIFADGTGTM